MSVPPAPATVAYVGWNGRGNTGDDAMFEALAGELAPVATVESFPVYAKELVGAATEGRLTALRRAHLLLGGGTLLGRSVWRKTLLYKAFPLVRREPRFMVGVGVEDPSFQGRHSFSDAGDELWRWPSLLRRFRRVSVRGPRSQELLAELGIEATVAGDPALLLRAADGVEHAERVLGVTLGFGDDLWGHDHGRVERAVAGCLRTLLARGWRVRLLCMNEEDGGRHRTLAGGDRVTVEMAGTPAEYLAAAAGCEVMIAERLHAMVLSAAAGTPFVGLDYQPKCADFARSVQWTEWTVRTDAVDASALTERVEALAEAGDRGRVALGRRVDELRRRLGAETAAIRSWLEAA